MIKKIKSFASIPWVIKCMFAEALLTSAYVKATLLFLPFRNVATWLGSAGQLAEEVPSYIDVRIIEEVRFAVKLCDKYALWPTECYTRSLTGKIMLKRRKIPSTLFFGFGTDNKGETMGHAWLKCSDILVTGFCDFSRFKVHSSFS